MACNSNHKAKQIKTPLKVPAAPTVAPVTAELVMLQDTEGTRWVGVHFKIEAGWHIYGKDPGDSGLPTRLDWKVHKSIPLSEVYYPPTQRFSDPGNIVTHGYTNETLLLSNVLLSKKTSFAPTPIGVHARWLACHPQQCIPGEATFNEQLTFQDHGNPALQALFKRLWPNLTKETPKAL